MFYVYDHITQAFVRTGTMEEICRWWQVRFRKNFQELNVTGKDTYPVIRVVNSLTDDGETYYDYIRTDVLRRYQVFDGQMRSVDIREWPEKAWTNTGKKSRRFWFWGTGSKNHMHRVGGPSMYHGTMRAVTEPVDTDEFHITYDRSHVRNGAYPSQLVAWDYYEYRHAKHYSSSKCWKDQTRSRRQYSKHKPYQRSAPEAIHEDGNELAQRLMTEFASSPA